MRRLIYTLLLTLLLPFVLIRLWWRGKSNPAYRLRISERLGDFKLQAGPDAPRRFWIHAVSVGEVNAAVPLIQQIQAIRPGCEIVVTTMTPTGADQVNKQLGNSVVHRYVPYDIPCLINRALDQCQPVALIIMETEIWPNWIFAADKRDIPVIYMSLRLSDKSFSGYKKIRSLIAPALSRVKLIAAQTDTDAQRIIALGANPNIVNVPGNIKYDAVLAQGVAQAGQALRQKIGESRLVWIAASTHDNEDEQVLEAHAKVCGGFPDALLIIVPRHPERFDRVFELCQQQFNSHRRTAGDVDYSAVQVYVGDTMGELLTLYAASDICFVGGSLVAHGGQNVLEPWLIGRPVIVGPHMFNFSRITAQGLDHNALIQVSSASALGRSIIELARTDSLSNQLVENATMLLKQNKGALEKSLKLLEDYL